MSAKIEKGRVAVETMHHCKARHAASEPVIELFQGELAWGMALSRLSTRAFQGETLPCLELRGGKADAIRDGAGDSARRFSGNRRQGGDCCKGKK